MQKRGVVRGHMDAENADVIILEDQVMMWFLRNGNSCGRLGAKCGREQKCENKE